MVKIHVFSGFESERLKIRRDMLLGHLYSDKGTPELIEAARAIGVNPAYLQNSRGFFHFIPALTTVNYISISRN
jgi:hypothetical protein